jgi:hypothetical protein
VTRRLILSALAATIVVGMVVASAASLAMSPGSLQADNSSVAACDTSVPKFTHSFTTSGGNVTQVTVGDIDPACTNGQLSVRLTDGSASIGSGGPVTVTGPSHNVAIPAQPAATSVGGIHILVLGP